MPGWRNGRRCGLKIRCPKGRAGSTPALGTNINLLLLQQRVLFLEIDPCPVLHAPSFENCINRGVTPFPCFLLCLFAALQIQAVLSVVNKSMENQCGIFVGCVMSGFDRISFLFQYDV